MNKRLDKLQARKVARAKERVKLSQPDVRTSEQIQAARDATKATWSQRAVGMAHNAPPAFLNSRAGARGAAKADTN